MKKETLELADFAVPADADEMTEAEITQAVQQALTGQG